MNVTCSATNVCTTILNSSCVYYTGADLIYTGILTNDNLTAALEKINAKFQDAGLGYVFENGITQAIPGAPVKLGGVLTGDTVITSSGFDLTITEALIVGSVAISGGLPTQFLKADGSVDNTTYQPAGNYLTALTGDGTASGPGSAALTLATVNYSPGVFGNATHVPIVTVNAKGLVTSVTTTAINLPPTLASFSGDLTGIGNIDTPITLTLNTVNSNVYASNTFLKFGVNGKGLVTSAAPITPGDIYGVLGYTPVTDARTITINGVTKNLTANRSWTIDSLPPQLGNNGGYLKTDGFNAFWTILGGNISQFFNDVGYIVNVPTLTDVLVAGNNAQGASATLGSLSVVNTISVGSSVTADNFQFPNGSTITYQPGIPRTFFVPDADGIIPMSVNGVIATYDGNISIPIGNGTVTEVIGTGSVSGITLSGNVTSSGFITLGGSLTLQSLDITDGLGYTPYDAANPSGFITASALSPYLTTAIAENTYYPLNNPNGFITINSIYSLNDAIGYNDGAIYINNDYSIPSIYDVNNWNAAYYGRIATLTTNSNTGAASYDTLTNTLNIPNYTLAGLGGITSTFISATGPILSYNSGTGVIAHNTTDGYLHVPATGTTNNNKYLKAGATAGSLSWATIDTSLQNILDTNHNLSNGRNFQGTGAGSGNTGSDINAFGANAGYSNSGSNVNAFGLYAGYNNSGSYVNFLGNFGLTGNTYSYVNLLGNNATATGNNQTVLGGQNYKVRLSYNNLINNVTHSLPIVSGTYVLSVNGQTADATGAITIPAVTNITGTGTVSGITLSGNVTSTGNLTLGGSLTLTNQQVIDGLGYTPYNNTNPLQFISRTGISSSATGLTYTSGTGVFSLTSGYSIPTTTSQSNWDLAYNSRITSLTTNYTVGLVATLVNNTLNIPTPSILALGGVPATRTLTINGTTYDLSANRSWTIPVGTGTVTNVSASVPGSFALALNVTNPTTTPNIALSAIGDASQYIRGDGTLATLPTPPPSPSGGIGTLNSLTANTQFFGIGTTGLDFNIDSTTATHTFNIPDASATARGLITIGAQTIAGVKTFSSGILGSIANLTGGSAGSIPYQSVANTTLFVSPGTTGQALISNGSGAPTFGTLSIIGGGTGATSFTSGRLIKYDGTKFVDAIAGGDYLVPNSNITAGTNLKITYDAKGLVTGGTTAAASDLNNGTIGTGAIVLANTPTLITPNIGVATGTSLSVTGQLTSTIATGTAPLTVSSTTQVNNLTAEFATKATNVIGGAIGAVVYQTGLNTTGFSLTTTTPNLPLLSGTAGTGQPGYAVLGFAGGGTGQTTQQAALNALAGSVSSGTFLRGNGTNVVMSVLQSGDIPNNTADTSGKAGGISGTRTANLVYASPDGSTGLGDFRALVAADLPATITSNTSGSAGSISVANAVTFDKIAQGSARSVIGNAGNSSANIGNIQSTSADQVLVSTATSVGWGTVNTAGITNKAVTIGKIQDINTNVILGRTTASSGDIEQLTPATVTGMLTPFAGTTPGLVPTGSGNDSSLYLNGAGGWTTVSTGGYTVQTRTASDTFTTASGELIVLVDNGSNNVTITIPNANASTAKITIKKISSATNFNLIVNTTGGLIDDGSSINLKSALQYTSVTMVSNGANWFII